VPVAVGPNSSRSWAEPVAQPIWVLASAVAGCPDRNPGTRERDGQSCRGSDHAVKGRELDAIVALNGGGVAVTAAPTAGLLASAFRLDSSYAVAFT